MDGVVILNSYQSYSVGWFVIFTISLLTAITCFIVFCGFLDESIIVSAISCGLCLVLIIVCLRIPKTITNYQVIIENFASWKEITNHYKIISIRGEIITVQELSEKGR